MKIFKYIIGLMLSLAMFVSCQDDEYEPLSEFSDAVFYTSYGSTQSKAASVGDWESFMDNSQGAIYHSWTINEGNHYMEGSVPNNTENPEDYVKNPGKTVTNDINAAVLFLKGDTATKISLFNVFEDSVGYRGLEQIESSSVPKIYAAEYQDSGKWAGKWVFEYDIFVDVYDTIITDMVMRQNGEVIPHDVEGDTVTIKVGEALEFEDLSAEIENTSRPDSRTWQVRTIPEEGEDYQNVTSSTAQIANINFKMMGVFNVALIAKRTSTDKIPGDSEEYVMETVVQVLQSDEPFVQKGAINQLEDGTLQVPCSAVFNENFSASVKDHFEVLIEGQASLSISKVELQENNLDKLILSLSDKLYPGDVATLVYSGTKETSDLQSQDERPLEAFTSSINLFDPNLVNLKAASFDDNLGEYWVAGTGGDDLPVEYSSDQAYGGSGHSMKVQVTTYAEDGASRGRFQGNAGELLNLTPGVYTVKYKRYVESAGLNMSSPADKIFLKGPSSLLINKDITVDGVNYQSWDSAFRDMWEELEYDINIESEMVGAYLYFQVNPGDFTVYYDDIYISPKIERP